MKKILAITVAAAALVSSPAFAQASASDSFTVTAAVQPECSIDDPANVNFGNVAINQNSGSDALLVTPGLTNTFQNIWTSCNYGARMTISSANGGLLTPELNDGADAVDFTNLIHYRISMTAQSNSAFLTTHMISVNGPSGSRVNTDAFHDNASLRVYLNGADNTKRPLAGAYSDTATITVGPV